MFISFTADYDNSIIVRQAEIKRFSKNMDQLRLFKAFFYGVKVRISVRLFCVFFPKL